MDRYTIPSHLDDPELIGFWTLDEFLAMTIPFVWGTAVRHPAHVRDEPSGERLSCHCA